MPENASPCNKGETMLPPSLNQCRTVLNGWKPCRSVRTGANWTRKSLDHDGPVSAAWPTGSQIVTETVQLQGGKQGARSSVWLRSGSRAPNTLKEERCDVLPKLHSFLFGLLLYGVKEKPFSLFPPPRPAAAPARRSRAPTSAAGYRREESAVAKKQYVTVSI